MSPSTVHLLVLVHGMWGHPGNLSELKRIAGETYSAALKDGSRLEILVPETNRDASTYDGIDWGGERVAKEILDRVSELDAAGVKVTKLSVTGYSLGGLVARYVVGILLQQGFFDNVEPVNFNTIATPNIGLPRYCSIMSVLSSALVPKLLSRTGEQFYCVDKWSPNGRPLLLVMADPERIFYKALQKFKNLKIYANGVNDGTVPYVTAAIETEDPFAEHATNGIDIQFHDEYNHVIKSHALPETAPTQPVVLSREWFNTVRPSRSLPFRFPLNVLAYTLLPVVIPAAISVALVKFSLESHSSRARIKALEKLEKEKESLENGSEKSNRRLAQILAELEQELENMSVEVTDDDSEVTSATSNSTPPSSGRSTPPLPQYQKGQPILNPHQQKIVVWLNTLPLKKEVAFFPHAMNAHAMIISRDLKRAPGNRSGESVIRHWADSLEI
ncbi:DUF676-domain-containing protein [Coprinopsis marcescibilis]|uniref:DUF676-domain-containing protein n=1 Tax=Coprinopsis marcescibilis TaxID=230819 RepID=A0A5C3KLS1_COPMA|nr:DUF676-domain-containing protein [Coprinopsis marcescibilis]